MAHSATTITLIQMDCELGKPRENFAHAAALIAEARRLGSDLVVLPELWSTGYDLENAEKHASVLGGRARGSRWFGRFAALAKANHLWLTGSLLETQADGHYYNCMPVYDPNGALAAAYRKVHLFRLMQEDAYLAPGQDTTLLDLPWGRTGLAICYDLRFPELFRRYALNRAHLILIPAEWPSARQEHWTTLLRARAIENQCFVAACNRVGTSRGYAVLRQIRHHRSVGRNRSGRRRGRGTCNRYRRHWPMQRRAQGHPRVRRPPT